jgi:hypothetical protein
MSEPLLPTRFLFRFSASCLRRDPLWTDQGWQLDESFRLVGLAELEGRTAWADVRAAWSEQGLAFCVHVQGKSQPPWCRSSKLEDSDGLQVWIDTRDVHNVHRASRFCHRFIFLPANDKNKKGSGVFSEGRSENKKGSGVFLEGRSGKRLPTPIYPAHAECLPINRAKELPHPVRHGALQARCQILADGYLLEALIPAEALTGFDTVEHPRLGFTYAVIDRELGEQTFGVGSPMPYQEDPSLWTTLELRG